MASIAFQAARLLRTGANVLLLGGAALLAGCAHHYVDGSTREAAAADFVRPAQLRPVQLVAEFQTKGVSNARATEGTKPMIAESVKGSGLFSEVRDAPAADAGLLSVTINNVPLTDDAAAKGFIAGLTFGAAGQQVTDGYLCTVSYLPPGGSATVIKTSRHAIHTTVGASAAPVNAYKASSIDEAVRMMIKQVVSVALSQLSHDPAFK
jgi:hypothetical protein